MKKVTCFILIVFLLCATVSCNSPPKISESDVIGTWESEDGGAVITINADGTATIEYNVKYAEMYEKYEHNWTIENNRILDLGGLHRYRLSEDGVYMTRYASQMSFEESVESFGLYHKTK